MRPVLTISKHTSISLMELFLVLVLLFLRFENFVLYKTIHCTGRCAKFQSSPWLALWRWIWLVSGLLSTLSLSDLGAVRTSLLCYAFGVFFLFCSSISLRSFWSMQSAHLHLPLCFACKKYLFSRWRVSFDCFGKTEGRKPRSSYCTGSLLHTLSLRENR